jgi:hypothetical protein
MLIVVPAHLQPCPSLIYWLAAMLIVVPARLQPAGRQSS